jgi:hypothetical protein
LSSVPDGEWSISPLGKEPPLSIGEDGAVSRANVDVVEKIKSLTPSGK